MTSPFSPDLRSRRAYAQAVEMVRKLNDCDPSSLGVAPHDDDLRVRMGLQKIWRAGKEIQAANGVVGSALDGGPPHHNDVRERMALHDIWRMLGGIQPCDVGPPLPVAPYFVYYSLDAGVTWRAVPEATVYNSLGNPFVPNYIAPPAVGPAGAIVGFGTVSVGFDSFSVGVSYNYTTDLGVTYTPAMQLGASNSSSFDFPVWVPGLEAFFAVQYVFSAQPYLVLWKPGDEEQAEVPISSSLAGWSTPVRYWWINRESSGPPIMLTVRSSGSAGVLIPGEDPEEEWDFSPYTPPPERLLFSETYEDDDFVYEVFSEFNTFLLQAIVRSSTGNYVAVTSRSGSIYPSPQTRIFHSADLETWYESTFDESMEGQSSGPRDWNIIPRAFASGGVLLEPTEDDPYIRILMPRASSFYSDYNTAPLIYRSLDGEIWSFQSLSEEATDYWGGESMREFGTLQRLPSGEAVDIHNTLFLDGLETVVERPFDPDYFTTSSGGPWVGSGWEPSGYIRSFGTTWWATPYI